MGVIVHRNLDIFVSHDVLQGFGIHTGQRHLRTEGVPHGVLRTCHSKPGMHGQSAGSPADFFPALR